MAEEHGRCIRVWTDRWKRPREQVRKVWRTARHLRPLVGWTGVSEGRGRGRPATGRRSTAPGKPPVKLKQLSRRAARTSGPSGVPDPRSLDRIHADVMAARILHQSPYQGHSNPVIINVVVLPGRPGKRIELRRAAPVSIPATTIAPRWLLPRAASSRTLRQRNHLRRSSHTLSITRCSRVDIPAPGMGVGRRRPTSAHVRASQEPRVIGGEPGCGQATSPAPSRPADGDERRGLTLIGTPAVAARPPIYTAGGMESIRVGGRFSSRQE